jgi:hypothetical protein
MRPRVSLVAVALLATGARAERPEWTFDEAQEPIRYQVRLEHEEKGDDTDKVSLDLGLELRLRSVAEGDGTWEVSIQHVDVERVVGGKKRAFDSRKKGREPAPAVRWFAELAEKKLDVTVSKGGDLKAVTGALAGVPGPGDFLAEGADLDKLVAEALLGEVVAKLFRLPGARGYGYGVICRLGNAVAGCHLSQETEQKREHPAKHGVKREWAATLQSDGGSIRAGGVTLTLREGKAGGGSGTGVYAPGYLVSLEEKLEYEMPTPGRTAKFKRSLKVNKLD